MRQFIAIAEKELELYYRHVALYGGPNDRDPKSISDPPKVIHCPNKTTSLTARELSEDEESSQYLNCEGDAMLSEDLTSCDEGADEN